MEKSTKELIVFDSLNRKSESGSGISEGSLKWEYECLDTNLAARYLKVSIGALRNMTSNGRVPVCKLGGRNRYMIKDLRELLLKHREGVCNGN